MRENLERLHIDVNVFITIVVTSCNFFLVHINNVQLGRYGRHRTNLWDYAGINSFGRGREEA